MQVLRIPDIAGDFNIVDLSTESAVKAVSYAEKQLISPEFAKERVCFCYPQMNLLRLCFAKRTISG